MTQILGPSPVRTGGSVVDLSHDDFGGSISAVRVNGVSPLTLGVVVNASPPDVETNDGNSPSSVGVFSSCGCLPRFGVSARGVVSALCDAFAG